MNSVAVLGGGPAGSFAAERLARAALEAGEGLGASQLLSRALIGQGRLEEAEASCRQAVRLRHRFLGGASRQEAAERFKVCDVGVGGRANWADQSQRRTFLV